MTPKETSEYLLNKFEFIPLNIGFGYYAALDIRKKCALITAEEMKSNFELDHDPAHYLFWEEVIKLLK